ncbi:hypothetical protein LXA43DRAFT_903249 [Ganoderma leucocontextum]|nr:hypothetical protein LXA43DRAFT_903249 [Ganoderma leucocontextum]
MFKAVIVVLCGVLFGAVLKPPQPPAKKTIVYYRGQPLEYIVRGLCYFGVIVLSVAFACFAASIVALSGLPATQTLVPYVCPTEQPVSDVLRRYSLRFAAGATFVSAGALLRLWAFRTLGALFTFEVVITPEHRLIRSGPYAFARHPSYTGLIMLLFGVHLVQFGHGGYVTACNIVATPAGFLVYVWWACMVFVPVSLLRRCYVEDEQLCTHFGDTWLQYEEDVPYRLLPFVY